MDCLPPTYLPKYVSYTFHVHLETAYLFRHLELRFLWTFNPVQRLVSISRR